MKILVSGSSGMIGSALSRRLAADGHQIVRLVRPPTTGGASTGSPEPGETTDSATVAWDPQRGALDQAALEGHGPYDGVVHLAGAGVGDHRWSPRWKAAILDSRIRGTGLLARSLAALASPPPVMISSSAVGYYGDRGDETLTEASPPGIGFLAEVCQAWEAATDPAGTSGIRVVHLRTGYVLSPHGGSLGKQLPLFRVGLGGKLGSGRQYRSWITLEDEVAAIVHCIGDLSLAGPVNATAPHPATDAQLATALGRALHRPALVAAPAAALRLALGSEMASELVLFGQRVLPQALTDAGFQFAHSELDGALRSVLA